MEDYKLGFGERFIVSRWTWTTTGDHFWHVRLLYSIWFWVLLILAPPCSASLSPSLLPTARWPRPCTVPAAQAVFSDSGCAEVKLRRLAHPGIIAQRGTKNVLHFLGILMLNALDASILIKVWSWCFLMHWLLLINAFSIFNHISNLVTSINGRDGEQPVIRSRFILTCSCIRPYVQL